MSVLYPGPSFDGTRGGDELSMKVLKSTMPEIKHSFDPDAEYANHLLLRWH